MSASFWVVAIGVIVVIRAFLPPYMALLVAGGLQRPNYREQSIPVAVGLLPAFVAALGAIVLGTLEGNSLGTGLAAGMLGAGVVGLLDDTVGNRSTTGLRGHLGRIATGELSTGALKAVLIPLLALFLALGTGRSLGWVLLDGALIALTANAINLLDVRPGRAVKGSLLLLLVSFPTVITHPPLAALWGMITLAIVVYAPADLQAQAMLGDSGSNAFGLASGWVIVQSWGPWGRMILWLGLVILHGISERKSLTDIIENNRWLRTVDRWGRGNE